MNENAVDKYDLSLRLEPKRHKTWQGQYVQDMLDGLKNKTTDQKLDDAFDPLDFFHSCNTKNKKQWKCHSWYTFCNRPLWKHLDF